MYTWPEAFLINTDWTDTPSMALVENKPEVGLPIRRRRSLNIQHTLSASFVLNYTDYHNTFLPFMASINQGMDSFYFYSPIDSMRHETKLQANSGQFYDIRRQDDYTYIINLTFLYVTAA